MEAVVVAIGVLAGLVGVGLSAWRWGVDSREPFDSPEWEHRRHWRGFGGQ
jgi:hypothetical protein